MPHERTRRAGGARVYSLLVPQLFDRPPHVHQELTGKTAARDARRCIARLLPDGVSEEVRSDVLLLVSEIVTNAIKAAGSCTIGAWYRADEGVVRVEVVDTSPDLPQIQERSSARVGGHGLRVVDAVSSDWGVIHRARGKAVWFELG